MSSNSSKISEVQQNNDVTHVDVDAEEMCAEDDPQQDDAAKEDAAQQDVDADADADEDASVQRDDDDEDIEAQENDDATQEDAEAAGGDAEESAQEEESEADTGSEMSDEDEDEDDDDDDDTTTTATTSATCANASTTFSWNEAKQLLAGILHGLARKQTSCVEAALMVMRKCPELAAKNFYVTKHEDGVTYGRNKLPMFFFLQDNAANLEQIKELYDLNPEAYESGGTSNLKMACKNRADPAVLDFFIEKVEYNAALSDELVYCTLLYFEALKPAVNHLPCHERQILLKLFQLCPDAADELVQQFVFHMDGDHDSITWENESFLFEEYPPTTKFQIDFDGEVDCNRIKLISQIFALRKSVNINISRFSFHSGYSEVDRSKLAAFEYLMSVLESNQFIERVTFSGQSVLVEPEAAAMERYIANNQILSSLNLQVESPFFSASSNWKGLWRAIKQKKNLQVNLEIVGARVRHDYNDGGEHDDDLRLAIGEDGMVAFNNWLGLPNLKRLGLECVNFGHLELANLELAHLEPANVEPANLEAANLELANLELATSFCETKVERMDVNLYVYGSNCKLVRQIAKMPSLKELSLTRRGDEVLTGDLKQLVSNMPCLSQLRLGFLPEDIQEIASAAQKKECFSRLTCDVSHARPINKLSLLKTVSENSKLVLENVSFNLPGLPDDEKVQDNMISYYSLLNELGRSHVESACLTPDAFVKLLHNVTTYDDTHFSCLATKHNIQYELLRLRPSIWSVTFHKCSGDKRKNGSSKANEDDEAKKRQRRVA